MPSVVLKEFNFQNATGSRARSGGRSLGVQRETTSVSVLYFCCLCSRSPCCLAAGSSAQNLTLEGQTGGFLTPTAYVVYAEKGHFFSHPAVGFHFIDASKVIGNIETVSITESFASRAEVGYTRSIHQFGDSGSGTTVLANACWDPHRRPPRCRSCRISASFGTPTA